MPAIGDTKARIGRDEQHKQREHLSVVRDRVQEAVRMRLLMPLEYLVNVLVNIAGTFDLQLPCQS